MHTLAVIYAFNRAIVRGDVPFTFQRYAPIQREPFQTDCDYAGTQEGFIRTNRFLSLCFFRLVAIRYILMPSTFLFIPMFSFVPLRFSSFSIVIVLICRIVASHFESFLSFCCSADSFPLLGFCRSSEAFDFVRSTLSRRFQHLPASFGLFMLFFVSLFSLSSASDYSRFIIFIVLPFCASYRLPFSLFLAFPIFSVVTRFPLSDRASSSPNHSPFWCFSLFVRRCGSSSTDLASWLHRFRQCAWAGRLKLAVLRS